MFWFLTNILINIFVKIFVSLYTYICSHMYLCVCLCLIVYAAHLLLYFLSFSKCCGQSAYGLAQRRVLCCNNTLYKDREDGEECSEISFPFNPAKGTTCCSQFHGSPGQHCCGTETYRPHSEICCNGHRWLCLHVHCMVTLVCENIHRIHWDRSTKKICLVCCNVFSVTP